MSDFALIFGLSVSALIVGAYALSLVCDLIDARADNEVLNDAYGDIPNTHELSRAAHPLGRATPPVGLLPTVDRGLSLNETTHGRRQ
jgi:hypothetical protein